MAGAGVLTTGQAARWCGVNFRTVLRWIERGELTAYQLPGRGDHRIRVDDFIGFLRRHKMPVPPQLADGKPRILVVDRDRQTVKAICQALTDAGYECRTTDNGFSAGLQLATLKPDVLTIDPYMDGVGGPDALRFVRDSKQFEKTRIIAVCCLNEEQQRQILRSGADEILAKPVDRELLVRKVVALSGAPVAMEASPSRKAKASRRSPARRATNDP